LDLAAFPEQPVVPFGRPVHDRLRLEIARGCTRGCRFCQAGMIYRPVRERSPQRLMALVRRGLESTGYEDVSLLSLSTGDYSCINGLAETLMAELTPRHIALSLPSLRAGSLRAELMDRIRQVRKTGFTFAVEAGSQRLRDVINKNITEEDVFDTLRDAFDLGWQTIKLYFMIGLPTETDADLDAIVALVERLRRLRLPGGRRGQLNVSVATFIPKAHTPFQWAGQASLEGAQEKIDRLRRQLGRPGVQFKWQNPQVSLIEGLWARGDRRLAPLLVEAYRRGCRLDGWSDQFRFAAWLDAIAQCGIDISFYTCRTRDINEPLPWDHVDIGVQKEFLQREWHQAEAGEHTDDCRSGECQGCGVCDFIHLAPVVHDGEAVPAPVVGEGEPKSVAPVVLRLCFRKTGPARLFGHLETANIFQRAFRRTKLPVVFSGGFHPKPKMAFDDALPLGLESLAEYLTVHLEKPVAGCEMLRKLNRQLPEGFEIREVFDGKSTEGKAAEQYHYRVGLFAGMLSREAVERFEGAETWVLERVSAKGRPQRIDLKRAVGAMATEGDKAVRMSIRNMQGPCVRPADVLKAVFGLDEDSITRASVVKVGADSAPWSEKVSCSES
jgi:radical SAM-linked protein